MNPSAAEAFGQFGTGSMQPGLDGANRTIDDPGNLFVMQALFMEQSEDHSIIGPQIPEGAFEFLGEVIGVGEAGTVIDTFLGRFGQDRPAAPTTQRGPATVGGDPQEPGTESPSGVETCDSPQCANKRFLNDILGVLAVPHHPEAETEDHSVETVEQEARSLRITGPDCIDHRLVVHLVWPSPDDRNIDEQSNIPGYLRMEDHVSGFVSNVRLLRLLPGFGNEVDPRFRAIGITVATKRVGGRLLRERMPTAVSGLAVAC